MNYFIWLDIFERNKKKNQLSETVKNDFRAIIFHVLDSR